MKRLVAESDLSEFFLSRIPDNISYISQESLECSLHFSIIILLPQKSKQKLEHIVIYIKGMIPTINYFKSRVNTQKTRKTIDSFQ